MEEFSKVLVDVAQQPAALSLSAADRDRILSAWNRLEECAHQPQKFHLAYVSHWGNTLYGRTKRADLFEAGGIQRRKKMNRYTPLTPVSAQHNRLMYCVIKQIWLCCGKKGSPKKDAIVRVYEWLQRQILVDDPILGTIGIPLPKVNSKCVRDFIRKQERLINFQSTRQPTGITKCLQSISSADLPAATPLPDTLPPADGPGQYLWYGNLRPMKQCTQLGFAGVGPVFSTTGKITFDKLIRKIQMYSLLKWNLLW